MISSSQKILGVYPSYVKYRLLSLNSANKAWYIKTGHRGKKATTELAKKDPVILSGHLLGARLAISNNKISLIQSIITYSVGALFWNYPLRTIKV